MKNNKSGNPQQSQKNGTKTGNRNQNQKGLPPKPRKREAKLIAKQVAKDIEEDPHKLMKDTIDKSRRTRGSDKADRARQKRVSDAIH